MPITISTSPRKNVNLVGTAMLKCPAAMIQPPTNTAFRWPQSWSATQPPGRPSKYTKPV